MDKLIKVIALDNEFMQTGDIFCIKGKEYPVTEQYRDGYCIISESGKCHYFEYHDSYFELVFQNEVGEFYSKTPSQDLLEYRGKIKRQLEQLQIQLDDLKSII